MRTLRTRTALITGATGDIGAAVARRLAARGARLVLTGRDDTRLAVLARQLGGAVVDRFPADLRDAAAGELVARRCGGTDLLVHAAAAERAASFAAMPLDDLAGQLDVDLGAALGLVHGLLPGMLARGRGHVVLVGSLAALLGGAFQVPYASAKAGLDAATRALRAEYGGSGVGFSVVHPAPVRDAGRYARRRRVLGRVPVLVGETTAERVARAVVGAVRRDRAQVLVGPRAVRPVLAVQAGCPALGARIVGATGATSYFRRVAGSS